MLREARNIVRKLVPWSTPFGAIEILVAMAMNVRSKGYSQFWRSSLSAVRKSDRSMGLPVHITIEPTNLCNLKCPVCETGAGTIKRSRGTMSMDVYGEILSEIQSYVNTIFLYWMGEPFINKRIYDMARGADDLRTWVETCTNGELVEPASLALSGFSAVSFQFGGMSPATHAEYRVKGDWGKALHKLCDVYSVTKNHGRPQISAGLIVMKHNEHEIGRFLDFMSGYGVKQAELIAPCVRTVEQARQFLPVNKKFWLYDEDELIKGELVPKVRPHNSCPWIYYSTVVAWDGTVYPCCRDADGEHPMGNLNDLHMAYIWNGPKYREFRHRVATDQRNIEICRLCSGFGVPLLH